MDFTDPAQFEAFRAPGGRHETVCEPIVEEVAREILRRFE